MSSKFEALAAKVGSERLGWTREQTLDQLFRHGYILKR